MAEYIVDPVLSSDAVSFDEALAEATRISAGFNRDANIYKLVGTMRRQEPVFEPLEDTEPPKKKALDVTLEQREKAVIATLKHIGPKLLARYAGKSLTLATDGTYKVCLMRHFKIYSGVHDLTVGRCGTVSAEDFGTEAAAAEYVERITKLLDIINANEPQEGGEA
jgi:hypothetical protein